MELTYRELDECIGALDVYHREQGKVSAKIGIQFARLSGILRAEFKTLLEHLNQLVEKHKTGEDEKTKQPKVDADTPNYAAYIKERDELLATKITVTADKVEIPGNLELDTRVITGLSRFLELK